MAAIVGPEMLSTGASPQHLAVSTEVISGLDDSDLNKSEPSPRNPPPNPPFVFPARPSSSSAPSSYSRASGRRPKSLADSFQLGAPSTERRQSLSPPLPDFSFSPGARSPVSNPATSPIGLSPLLPDFKFNPGAALPPPPPEHPFLSPPQSPHTLQTPSSPRAIPTRPGHGHRRGGSEFVGGQIRSGDAITVLSTSPTKSESGFDSPQLKPTNPRRGHAHRRSTAISSHDLSMIMKPNSPLLRGSSAPPSPAILGRVEDNFLPKHADQSQENQIADVQTGNVSAEPIVKSEPVDHEAKPQARPVTRARVGFSDTLEFIPRPLSLVSSDTSSTVTARPGHSLSGSISSIISLTGSTAQEKEADSSTLGVPRSSTDPRPSTAGAILERSQSPALEGATKSPLRRNSIPLLNIAALAVPGSSETPSPSKAPKRWSFFGLESFAGSSSPTQPRRHSTSSSGSASKQASSASSSEDRIAEYSPDPPTEEELPPLQKTASRKSSKKKKKKVRSWAGSILTKKPKHRHAKKPSKGRVPTIPSVNVEGCEDDSEDTFEAVPAPAAGALSPEFAIDTTAWRPDTPPEEEISYPMIDLDAALGPFNTPLPRNPEWEAAQRASGLSKRPLHSAARMTGFSGPGMNYQHRRAESAPEMPPFNRAGIPRFSSNSTMADVFEEDEEDDGKSVDNHKGAGSSHEDGQTQNIDIRVTSHTPPSPSMKPFDMEDDAVSSRALSHKGSGLSGLSDDDRTLPSKSDYSASSLHDEIIMEESAGSKWHGGFDNNYNVADGSDSATPSPRRVFKGKELPVNVSPLTLPTPSLAPISPYTISHSSSFPSPRSPMSYEDGNRISTAPSSVTEDNFQSLLMGEPGPEVRLSLDIPSLTSSNSTMTRESAFQAAQQLAHPPLRGERPASFSSPFGRRGSLASIGRLISTSHGERSKLSIETSFDAERSEKKKPGKVKRLSRMMQFWKPKSTTST